jgi:hypothetical protein
LPKSCTRRHEHCGLPRLVAFEEVGGGDGNVAAERLKRVPLDEEPFDIRTFDIPDG